MSRAVQIKSWIPGVTALLAGALLLAGIVITWNSLTGSDGPPYSGEGVRIATDPAGGVTTEPTRQPPAKAPALSQGTKAPSDFGLPQFNDAFDFHSMEAKSSSGKIPIGSSAFLTRKARATEVAQYYLLELGKGGWELVWQRDAKIHPNNDQSRPPITGTRLRWLDRNHRKQLTLLALDDPQADHTAQAVVSWATLPGRTGG